jgi:hypothetical protein
MICSHFFVAISAVLHERSPAFVILLFADCCFPSIVIVTTSDDGIIAKRNPDEHLLLPATQ